MKLNLSTLASATLATTFLLFQSATVAQAGGTEFSGSVMDTSKGYDLGTGKFQSFPFHVSVSVRGGYDDNVNLSSIDEQGSGFINTQLGVTYVFGSPRTQLSLNAGAGLTYYFDRNNDAFGDDSDNFDYNIFAAFAITHKASPRLTLSANMYATYQSQPDFQTFNFATINFSRQSQDFFFTVNKFSAGYAWTPRFSTLTSYTLGYTDYRDDVVSRFEDRVEHTFGNEFRFLVWPTTTLVAEYRFGIVDYTQSDFRSSTSHYLLAGFDHSFNPRFNMSFRGGAEFRSFDDLNATFQNADQNETSPYFEFTLNYALAQNTSITWSNRYSLEEPDVPEALTRDTYRTALSIRHAFTSRISAGLNVAYQHDINHATILAPGFDEDSIDIGLWARYSITRNWALDAGYNYTEVSSPDALFREYTRNRVYAGATFSF